jgi:hypothetical protein
MDIFANMEDSDDIFETKSKKSTVFLIKETILSYKPKYVYPKVGKIHELNTAFGY